MFRGRIATATQVGRITILSVNPIANPKFSNETVMPDFAPIHVRLPLDFGNSPHNAQRTIRNALVCGYQPPRFNRKSPEYVGSSFP